MNAGKPRRIAAAQAEEVHALLLLHAETMPLDIEVAEQLPPQRNTAALEGLVIDWFGNLGRSECAHGR